MAFLQKMSIAPTATLYINGTVVPQASFAIRRGISQGCPTSGSVGLVEHQQPGLPAPHPCIVGDPIGAKRRVVCVGDLGKGLEHECFELDCRRASEQIGEAVALPRQVGARAR